MEPIISSLWFYLIGIVDNLSIAFTFFSIILGTAVATFTAMYIVSLVDTYFEEHRAIWSKLAKSSFKLFIPIITFSLLIPTSDTIYKMIIADNVTPHNIEVVGDTIENSIDYIFEKINTIYISEGSGSEE